MRRLISLRRFPQPHNSSFFSRFPHKIAWHRQDRARMTPATRGPGGNITLQAKLFKPSERKPKPREGKQQIGTISLKQTPKKQHRCNTRRPISFLTGLLPCKGRKPGSSRQVLPRCMWLQSHPRGISRLSFTAGQGSFSLLCLLAH